MSKQLEKCEISLSGDSGEDAISCKNPFCKNDHLLGFVKRFLKSECINRLISFKKSFSSVALHINSTNDKNINSSF
jgi:hypothetical protein